MAKFHGNILNPSDNIATCFRGLLFWLILYSATASKKNT